LTSLPTIPSKSSDQEQPKVEVPKDATHGTDASRDQPLIHPLSALLLIVVDALWTMPDMAAFAWIATIPACFLAVFLPTFFIQKLMKKDSAGKAFAVAATLGILAAVPTPIMGTAVGAIALALSGLRNLGLKR
jgi:hypothetical protein